MRAPIGTGILFGGLLTAGAGGYALAGGLADRRELRLAFDLFGSMARLMNAAAALLEQLTGPRGAVRNPLLASILRVADRVAPLLAQILGAVAFVIRRIGPLLAALTRMLLAIRDVIGSAVTALGTISEGLADGLKGALTGPQSIASIVHRVVAVARHEWRRARHGVGVQLDQIVTTLREIPKRLEAEWSGFSAVTEDYVRQYIDEHAVGRVIRALVKQLTAFTAAWKTTPAKPSAEPSPIAPLLAAVTRPLPTAPLPDFPTLPEFPSDTELERISKAMGADALPELTFKSIEARAEKLGTEREASEHLRLGPESRAALALALHRPSVFADERRLVQDAVLPLVQPGLLRIREALAIVIGRILPPAMRVYAPQLDETLRAIDVEIYGSKPTPAPKQPVLELPTDRRLRPKIKTLRLRMPGREENDVRRFEALVLERLRNRTYTVDGAAPAAAGGS